MNRNLHHRIEVCTTINNTHECKKELIDYFNIQWSDNDKMVELTENYNQHKIESDNQKQNKCTGIYLFLHSANCMKSFKNIMSKVSSVRRYRFNTILYQLLFYGHLIDIIVVLLFNSASINKHKLGSLLLREIIVFIASLGNGYLLVTELKRLFRDFNLITTLFIKKLILIIAAFLMNLLLYALNSISILGLPVQESFHKFYMNFLTFIN